MLKLPLHLGTHLCKFFGHENGVMEIFVLGCCFFFVAQNRNYGFVHGYMTLQLVLPHLCDTYKFLQSLF